MLSATTDQYGIYIVSGVAPGNASIEVTRQGYIEATSQVDVQGYIIPGEIADLAMTSTLPADGWRAVLSWPKSEDAAPCQNDLDSHVFFHADYKWGLSSTPLCQTLAQIQKAAGFFGISAAGVDISSELEEANVVERGTETRMARSPVNA